jgi:hypothetical protein
MDFDQHMAKALNGEKSLLFKVNEGNGTDGHSVASGDDAPCYRILPFKD